MDLRIAWPNERTDDANHAAAVGNRSMSLPIHVDEYSGHTANQRPRSFTLDAGVKRRSESDLSGVSHRKSQLSSRPSGKISACHSPCMSNSLPPTRPKSDRGNLNWNR